MNKWKTSLKYIRLTLVFAFVVFLIMLVTMFLTYCGALLFAHMGFIHDENWRRFPLFPFCLGSILIGTSLAAVFGTIPLRPLREIMDATDRIANGDYSARLSLKGLDELRALGDKFNHMAEELGSVEMLRTDFINNFSHEFKTPIVSIRGYAKELKQDDLTPEERNEYLDIIISESERLVSLSTNVLYLSKIEKQAILLDRKRFNLSEQIRLVLALLGKKFTDKNLEPEFNGKEIWCEGNEEMLKQVWINLLDNAIKFSPPDKKIKVYVTDSSGEISIKIQDFGNGMSPEQQKRIFDKFYQCDESHAATGNGLGLTIVKRIIDLHEGGITVCSSNKGSTFEVILKSINLKPPA